MAQDITAADYLTRSVDRNRYFYGKLMTVRDFLREQEYFNSKRWLINRLLFGSGVVSGLEVRPVGATVIEVEPGVAFDPEGREITVVGRERVDLAKLVTADVTPAGGAGVTDLLVCLNYHECPKEPVPSLKGSPCDEVCESNRIGETFTVSLLKAPPEPPPPTGCEQWLNRQTVLRRSDDFEVERVAPVRVRPGEVFEVAVKVTALRDLAGVTLSETVAGATFIEPNPQPPTQFPTPPVSLRRGEFFVYVYQVQGPGTPGTVQISGGAGVPTPSTTVQVTNDPAPAEASPACVSVARVRATFAGGNLTAAQLLDATNRQRVRYNLSRVAELLDCVRASLQAAAESQRPGHAFITFKDLEREDLQPIGPKADHGKAFTVTRGDHVHALLLYRNSGLRFRHNFLLIDGAVGGEKINFLHPVSGQSPVAPHHLATKGYVDSRIAGLDWQESVVTRKLSAPPAERRRGARYLVSRGPRPTPDNPWAGHANQIAAWDGNAWVFTAPDEGTAVFVEDENIAYLFVEGKWIPFLATPEVAAGKGLRADGAVLSVGQGPGLKVNENDVEVVFEPAAARPVGPLPGAGASPTAARGDHTHALPLTPRGGLLFGRMKPPSEAEAAPSEEEAIPLRAGLHINGQVGGPNIDFLHPVSGQNPVAPRHLATKQYVDGVASGLDWQNSVLDKDRAVPPFKPGQGARYLILKAIDEAPAGEEERRPEVKTRDAEFREAESREIEPKPDETTRPPEPRPETVVRNPWVGHENSITTWNGRAWEFSPPNEGMAVFVEDENTTYLFVEGNWIPFMAMPEVAAGNGLRADGAVLSVGPGPGLLVGENDVAVVFEGRDPAPSGPRPSPGTSPTAARGDHRHELPLAFAGGLEFALAAGDQAVIKDEALGEKEEAFITPRLRINGPVGGDRIDFRHPVLGQDPVAPRHLTTKQYVDGLVSGLTWQRTVLDKDLAAPPDAPPAGARYLLFAPPAGGSAWEGRQDNIATWNGRRWDFTPPTEGMAAFVADENLAYLYADGKWVQFLAPPAAVGAGNGLIQTGSDLAVGQGEGIVVSADAVSARFGPAPPPVGTAAAPGSSGQVAQSDHTHELPLEDLSGLEFRASSAGGPARLRLNGRVGGEAVDFRFPVLGQNPTDPRHLATKQYVDGRVVGTQAGDGLFAKENVISVGAGPGVLVGPDEVLLNFENGAPRPVGQFPDPGRSNTVARGDHTHAMPDVWPANAATGVYVFDLRESGLSRYAISFLIDPRLGPGAISVSYGLVAGAEGEGIFVGQVDQFEGAITEQLRFQPFPPVSLAARIFPTLDEKGANSTFEIWAHTAGKAESLPEVFRVRWWAYRAGAEHIFERNTPVR